jgi:hypothetical protein
MAAPYAALVILVGKNVVSAARQCLRYHRPDGLDALPRLSPGHNIYACCHFPASPVDCETKNTTSLSHRKLYGDDIKNNVIFVTLIMSLRAIETKSRGAAISPISLNRE